MMKRLSFVTVLLICFFSTLSAITVEVEDVLDAPENDYGTFFFPAAAYASNGQLVLKSALAFNLFVLDHGVWVRLIDRYRTEDYNNLPEGNRRGTSNSLFNSTIAGEMLYMARRGAIPPEHYRVFVNDEGQLEAEWVSQEYYETHLKFEPGFGYSLGLDRSLRYGFRIATPQSTVYTSPSARVPQIIGPDGAVVYNFMEEFPEGFVEDGLSITRNPAGDRVAMVISFEPEEDSPYYRPSSPRVLMMAIFRIDYGEVATEAEETPADDARQQDTAAPSIDTVASEPESEMARPPAHSAEDRSGDHPISVGVVAGGGVLIVAAIAGLVIIQRRRRS